MSPAALSVLVAQMLTHLPTSSSTSTQKQVHTSLAIVGLSVRQSAINGPQSAQSTENNSVTSAPLRQEKRPTWYAACVFPNPVRCPTMMLLAWAMQMAYI